MGHFQIFFTLFTPEGVKKKWVKILALSKEDNLYTIFWLQLSLVFVLFMSLVFLSILSCSCTVWPFPFHPFVPLSILTYSPSHITFSFSLSFSLAPVFFFSCSSSLCPSFSACCGKRCTHTHKDTQTHAKAGIGLGLLVFGSSLRCFVSSSHNLTSMHSCLHDSVFLGLDVHTQIRLCESLCVRVSCNPRFVPCAGCRWCTCHFFRLFVVDLVAILNQA